MPALKFYYQAIVKKQHGTATKAYLQINWIEYIVQK